MSEWNPPWDGGCMCGKIRFRISEPPLPTMACHCGGCQKLTASAFSMTIVVPAEGFAVTTVHDRRSAACGAFVVC